MSRLRRLMADRRRSQRGSVLSGVLIMTAFIATIAGALMTELSTNFLLSRALMHRVGVQATVDSAITLGMAQLQATQIPSGCPALPATTLNSLTASATYLQCGPTVDAHDNPQFASLAAVQFENGGTLGVVQGRAEYLAGDVGGNIWGFAHGAAPWWARLAQETTGPPLVMPDGKTIVAPVREVGGTTVCDSGCVAVISAGASSPACYMPTDDLVQARPASGANFTGVAFLGDRHGVVYAFDPATCLPTAPSFDLPKSVVDGPIILAGSPKGNQPSLDEVFVLISDSSGSQLVHLEYSCCKKPAQLAEVAAFPLAGASAVGMALDSTVLPSRLAITFAGGMVQLVQISSSYVVTNLATRQLSGSIADGPAWCCGANPATIAVAGRNGILSVLDANLALVASYSMPAPLNARPVVDAAGDWFVGATNGNVYEFPAFNVAPATALVFGSGQLGSIVAGGLAPCQGGTWLCGFSVGTAGAFEVTLDARSVTMSACVGSSPPACSGESPRLWARSQIGSRASQTAVRVQGWSYYSP